MLQKKFLLIQILNIVYGILKEYKFKKKKELCDKKIEKIKDFYIIIKIFRTFLFIKSRYICDIYNKIKSE